MELQQEKPNDVEIEADPVRVGEESAGNVQTQALKRETTRNQVYDRDTIRALNRQKISSMIDIEADTAIDNVGLVQTANASYLKELNMYNVSF